MRQHVPTIATILCVAIAMILMKGFGSEIGFGFMIIAALAVTGGAVVLRELLKHRREQFRKDIQQKLGGESMYDFLRRNPGHLSKMQSWSAREQAALLEALDPADARSVEELLR